MGGWNAAEMAGSEPLPSVDPSQLPRVEHHDLIYQGSFRLPNTMFGGDHFQYTGGPLAYDPATNSLFAGSWAGNLAELGIPANIVKSTNVADLPVAPIVQPFGILDDQNLRFVNNPADTGTRGLLINGQQLVISVASYYDASYQQTTSHYYRPRTLSITGQAQGPFRIGTIMPGHVAGYMAPIPAAWQSHLGGTAITGNFGLPIITRESFGPAAFVFDPADLGVINPASTVMLLDYPDKEHSLDTWDATSLLWNSSSNFSGVVFPAGTRSVLFFGVHGNGPFCYGDGTSQNPPGFDEHGQTRCYDLEHSAKGQHTYPYVYRVWAYDVNDLVRVRNGQLQSWEPRPYGVWDLTLPLPALVHKLTGIAYDSANQRIFISQGFGDKDPMVGTPVVHVYRLSDTPGIPPPPPPPTSGLPVPTLSLPGVLPLNADIQLANTGSYAGATFTWNVNPLNSFNGVGSKGSVSPVLGAPHPVLATSAVPRLSLASMNLSPGPHLITVQASIGSQTSALASANVTLVQANLNAVRIYPNPWRSDRNPLRTITFDNLTVNTAIKIFTTSGHHVKTLPEASSSVSWDLTNEGGDRVASGIYMYVMKANDGSKKTGQIVIIK